ncbi:hypothetical protein K431DRAFT_284402 [Polychaeton citri CBS 116435]|uniref:Aminoglycoside N(3)-acetyltransferase n=1 Tax=Polychaeton citri CBS 116435 TaxID=1314669 RepID=A0A9P4Q8W8_9PEZI|nr:hypothetical protein K431DRAFT_284402 [Polychaeton citri CBS 116435]
MGLASRQTISILLFHEDPRSATRRYRSLPMEPKSSTAVIESVCTVPSLTVNFRDLGLKQGDVLLVHSSFRSIGWVNGGAEAVVRALLDVLGEAGTLVVPTHSSDNSDPANWACPPVLEEHWQTIRDTMLPYDPRTTCTRGMGVIADTVRAWPGALRSAHPQTSFAAVGPQAEVITSEHALDCALGDRSPLAKLEQLKARILLLGVDFDACTAFHLAESRLSPTKIQSSFAATVDGGVRQWVTVQDFDYTDNDFEILGRDLREQRQHDVTVGMVGAAKCTVVSFPTVVAFAQQWFQSHR